MIPRGSKILTSLAFPARDAQLFDVANGLESLHDLDILYGNPRGVGSLLNTPGDYVASRPLSLIRQLCNRADSVVIDKCCHRPKGPCSPDGVWTGVHLPYRFPAAAIPLSTGMSKRLAPELYPPSVKEVSCQLWTLKLPACSLSRRWRCKSLPATYRLRRRTTKPPRGRFLRTPRRWSLQLKRVNP